jgi:hypothetical protein
MKSLLWLAVIGTAVNLCAEEIELFRASKAGSEVWVWESAQVKKADAKLRVSLQDSAAEAGNAFIADRFPFFPNARVELAVADVLRGNYTLQALGFSNRQHVATANLASQSTETGRRQFALKNAGFGPGIDEMMLKIWVGNAKDPVVVLDDLALILPLDGWNAEMDDRFKDATGWDNETLLITNTAEGAVFALLEGTSYGSARGVKRLQKRNGLVAVWNIERAENGDATLQVMGFGPTGEYLKSVDLVKNARAGWYAAPIGPGLPPETTSFEFKLWAGGAPNARLKFGRLLVLRPADCAGSADYRRYQ